MREKLIIQNISTAPIAIDGQLRVAAGKAVTLQTPLAILKYSQADAIFKLLQNGKITVQRYENDSLVATYNSSNYESLLYSRKSDTDVGVPVVQLPMKFKNPSQVEVGTLTVNGQGKMVFAPGAGLILGGSSVDMGIGDGSGGGSFVLSGGNINMYGGRINGGNFSLNSGTGEIYLDETATLSIYEGVINLENSKTPASSSATGKKGDICWDANYVYVCVDTNTWKRAALSTW